MKAKKIISLLLLASLCACQKVNQTHSTDVNSSGSTNKLATNSFTGPDFMIAVIPDTQYYTWGVAGSANGGGTLPMFMAQIDWIRNHRVDSNIVYVAHLGDITDNGADNAQWLRAKSVWYKLDTPLVGQTAIPNGVAVGNHDQTPHDWAIDNGDQTLTTTLYNQYFGIAHFSTDINGNPRPYYHSKAQYGNDSHFDLISAGGMDLLLLYTEYNNPNAGGGGHDLPGLNNWADSVLAAYPDRKAIIISHSIVDFSSNFSQDGGKALYTRIKARKNVIMMLGGHWAQPGGSGDSPGPKGEGYVDTTYDGHRVRAMLSDYQQREWGGNGKMRLIKFSPANDRFSVMTYSPFTNTYETDADSYFTRPMLNDERSSRTNDYNNSGKSKWAFFKDGVWKVQGMADVTFGVTAGNIPLTADFDGDGRTDIAIFKPVPGQWIFKQPSSTVDYSQTLGDVPVPADYNGDGKAEIAHWRPSTSTWYIYGVGGTLYAGHSADVPVPGDYDGDGKVDIALFKKDGHWFIKGQRENVDFGNSTGIPTPGDYNGDGKTDISVYNADTGTWFVEGMSGVIVVPPLAGDVPAPGDYDGDGKTDRAIYRPSTGQLFIYNGTTVSTTILGSSGYKILNLPYHIRKYYTGLF